MGLLLHARKVNVLDVLALEYVWQRRKDPKTRCRVYESGKVRNSAKGEKSGE